MIGLIGIGIRLREEYKFKSQTYQMNGQELHSTDVSYCATPPILTGKNKKKGIFKRIKNKLFPTPPPPPPTYKEVIEQEMKEKVKKQKLIRIMEKADEEGQNPDWFYISEHCPLTENYIRRHKKNIVWQDVNRRKRELNLSEDFQSEFNHKM